ncbi:MAG: InlB B-repeat-containing protein, partial [Mobilitalea sp.]
GAHSTNTMKANVWYSTNADFSQAIQVPFTTGRDGNYLIKDGATVVLASPNITLKESETFYLRVYPWHEASSIATGKYATIKDVVISNTISGGGGGGEATIPAVSILEVKSITTKSVICKSIVIDDGGSDLTAVGLCWSTNPEPTIEDNFSYDGNIVSEFSTYITGLKSGTIYYVRAYATNEVGTAYSEEITITTNAMFFKLYTNIVGSGKITVSPESNDLLFEQNSNIKLTAVPDNGWKFVGWSGDVTGTESNIDISMDNLKNITATFEIVVSVESENAIPINYSLKQNYPNPFNPVTKIKYALPERANVKLSIYDLLARELVVLVNGTKEAGWYEVSFDGTNLSSGTYFYRLEAGNYVEVKKLLLIK